MKDLIKDLKPWQVVLLVVGLAIGIAYLPLITATAVGVLFFIYREEEIKSFFGQTMKFGTALISTLIIAIMVQAILSFIFGVSLRSIVMAGGFKGILMNPAAVTLVVAKQLAAFIVVIGCAYLWHTSKKPRRRLVKMMVVLSLCYLGYQVWYSHLSASSKMVQHIRVSLLREGMFRVVSSRMKSVGRKMEDDANERELKAEIPPIRVLKAEANLVLKEQDSSVWRKGPLLKPDSEFYVHYEDYYRDELTQLVYVRVILVKDPNISGYLRLDQLDEKPGVVAKLLAFVKKQAESLKQEAKAETEAEPVKQANQKAKPVVPSNKGTPQPIPSPRQTSRHIKSKVREDVAIVTDAGWTDLELVPYPGDVIKVVSPDGQGFTYKEVDRMLVRIGGEAITDLSPVEASDHTFFGRTTIIGGPNSNNAPLRIKLEPGPPIYVKAMKVNS